MGAVEASSWSCLPNDAGSRPLQRLWGAGPGERLERLLRGAGEELSHPCYPSAWRQKESRPPCEPRVVGEQVFRGCRSVCPDFPWQLHPVGGTLEARGMWHRESGRGWEHVEGVSTLAGRRKPSRMMSSWERDRLTSEVFTIVGRVLLKM